MRRINRCKESTQGIRRMVLDPLFAPVLSMLVAGAVLGAVSISAPPARTRTHNASDGPQEFPEATWTMTSSESAGATVELSCGPFTHSTRSALKTDCKLSLRVLSSEGSASWSAAVASDQTDLAAGDQTARVAARSSGAGDGSLGLTVTLQNNDFSTLAAGDHVITVTGTISANF